MLALLVTVSQRVLQMMGHVCRKLHPQSSLGSAGVRTTCLDGSVISVFQVTGDTEEIHLENAEPVGAILLVQLTTPYSVTSTQETVHARGVSKAHTVWSVKMAFTFFQLRRMQIVCGVPVI